MDKDLEKEIEEMEKEFFNTPTNEEPIEEQPEVTTKPLEAPIIQEPQVDPWEKRFKNYKASTDLTIRDLRSELASFKHKYANLQDSYSEMLKKIQESPTNTSSIFSEEEIEVLGEPAVNAINKGVNELLEKKVKPLQEEVLKNRKELAERERKEAQSIAQSNYERFLSKLVSKVPDAEKINVEPGFLEYMEGVDEDSGYQRKYLFRQAEQALDVSRIASFFKEYKSLTSKNEEVLQKAITPSGVKGGESSVTQREKADPIITKAFIDKFYNDYQRGKYRGKEGMAEADRIERMIDAAVMEGRVEYIQQY